MPTDTAAKKILDGAAADKPGIIFPLRLTIGHKLITLFPALGESARASLIAKFNRFGRK